MIIKTIAAFISVCTFSVIIDVPKKYIAQAGFVGALGWLTYLICIHYDSRVWLATFLAGLIIATVANIFSKWYKAPVTVFLVPGIFPIVPGGQMYRSVYYILMSNAQKANANISETIQVAGAMALAIFVMDSIFRYIRARNS